MRAITLSGPHAIHKPVVTVGTFDGVHVGHCAVIGAVREKARRLGGTSVVVTFDPHPREIIEGAKAPGLLTTLPEKRRRLEHLGMEVMAVVPFTPALRNMDAAAFVETYLAGCLKVSAVIVGYDHGFGKNRQGGFETMQALGAQFGFFVEAVPPTLIDGKPVSSTRIRRAILQRDFPAVLRLLGTGYPVCGQVVSDSRRGRSLGFPTANLSLDSASKLLPPFGVYAGRAWVPEACDAVINFGRRPTFNAREPSFEVHLIGFSGNLYGQALCLEISDFLREERSFDSGEALAHQIGQDIQTAKALLSARETTF